MSVGARHRRSEQTGVEASARGVFTPDLLDACISCGVCLPACPTYTRTGVETSSPRGRINLMRALETGALGEDDPTVLEDARSASAAVPASRSARRASSTGSSSRSGARTRGRRRAVRGGSAP